MNALPATLSMHRTVGIASALACVATAGLLVAGPLNPPAGPVAPTFKTLAEVEPRIALSAANTPGDVDSVFRITQPGSYYLRGNIDSVQSSNKNGIEIAASNVTIDLNGFVLQGGSGSFDGIRTDGGAHDNIRVVNGVVRDWGSEGLYLAGGNHRIGSVSVLANGDSGIFCGTRALVEACTASSNGLYGILCADDGVVDRCTASTNVSDGIICYGFSGIVRGCNAVQNGNEGIEVGNSGAVIACTVRQNQGSGIFADDGSLIENCTSSGNIGSGIFTSNAVTVTACSSYSNGARGIVLGGGSTASNCTVYQNAQEGLFANAASSILDCTARGNTGDGIEVIGGCLVRGNRCSDNGFSGDGAGIHVTGIGSTIDSNSVCGNDRGIDVDQNGNVIIRNSASGNTVMNYDIFATNGIGPIGVAATATSPWANLSF